MIRLAQRKFEHGLSNRLTSKKLEGDCKDFWVMWTSVIGTKNARNVPFDGNSDLSTIVSRLADCFSCNFADSADNERLKKLFENAYSSYANDVNNHC